MNRSLMLAGLFSAAAAGCAEQAQTTPPEVEAVNRLTQRIAAGEKVSGKEARPVFDSLERAARQWGPEENAQALEASRKLREAVNATGRALPYGDATDCNNEAQAYYNDCAVGGNIGYCAAAAEVIFWHCVWFS